MNKYEFVRYIPTPTETYMGIAEIFIMSEFSILFKIILRKDGSGFFPAPASFKVKENGNDVYLQAFKIDSIRSNEHLNAFIIANVKKAIESASRKQQSNEMNQPIQYPHSLNSVQQTLFKEEIKEEFGELPF